MIIVRYITKEIVGAFLAITLILLLIALSNRFAVFLAKAATGELPFTLVFKVVSLFIPELLSYLMPLGFFIAILFALGRLYADSEMAVLGACGVSVGYVARIVLGIAFTILILTAALTLYWVPKITESRAITLAEGESLGFMQAMVPQRFQTFADGSLIFYIEDVSTKDNLLKGVFIAEKPDITAENHGWTLITANKAELKRDEKKKDFYLILKDGYRYQGMPGTADYTVVKFAEYGRAISRSEEISPQDSLKQKKSQNLWFSEDNEDTAEIEWRLSLPFSVPILALIAVSLARVQPRHGRFAKFLPAILIYIVYYNLFTLCKRWIANGVLPGYIGVWWVHIIFLLLGLWLFAKESGWINAKMAERKV